MTGTNLPGPPTPQDYATDLERQLAVARQDSLLPSWVANHLAKATRRALHAERLLKTIRGCTSIRSVHALIDQDTPDPIAPPVSTDASEPVGATA